MGLNDLFCADVPSRNYSLAECREECLYKFQFFYAFYFPTYELLYQPDRHMDRWARPIMCLSGRWLHDILETLRLINLVN